jgi:hypothetical protein
MCAADVSETHLLAADVFLKHVLAATQRGDAMRSTQVSLCVIEQRCVIRRGTGSASAAVHCLILG